MEYVSRGKLQTYLRESRTPNDYNNLHGPSAMLTSRDLTTFAHQVARGMHYLTEKGVSNGLGTRDDLRYACYMRHLTEKGLVFYGQGTRDMCYVTKKG